MSRNTDDATTSARKEVARDHAAAKKFSGAAGGPPINAKGPPGKKVKYNIDTNSYR